MGRSSIEEKLVNQLDEWLRKHQFQTRKELQITSKFLNVKKLTKKTRPQDQVRIDLAARSMIDHTYHFIEAESDLHVHHPTVYVDFAHYTYLLCPEWSFVNHEPDFIRQQVSFAKHAGIGILTMDASGSFLVRLEPRKNHPQREILFLLDRYFMEN